MFGTLRDVLRRKGNIVHTARDISLAGEAVMRLNRLGIGSLIVTDAYGLVGIFTERDVLRRLVATQRDPWKTPLREVMTTPVVTLGPDTTLENAMRMMTRRRARHIPVVDGSELLGLVSQGDLAVQIQHELQRDLEDLSTYVYGTHARPSQPAPR